MTVAAEVLKAFPLFDELDHDELGRIAEVARWEVCPAGQRLFQEGEANGSLYGVVEGSIRINKRAHIGIEQTLCRIQTGGFIGEVGFVNGGTHCASAEAVEDTRAFSLAREDFDSLTATDPQLGYKVTLKLAGQMGRCLRDMDDQYLSLSNYVWGRAKC